VIHTLRWAVLLMVAVVFSTTAVAKPSDPGVPVTIRVVTLEGEPIGAAVIRHPVEAARHQVNGDTGEWTGRALYLEDGKELLFEAGMTLEFEISAPGYGNAKVQYVVRKRKNTFSIVLEPVQLVPEREDEEEPHIQFGRDKPIDGAQTE
jgi:hypothetical protein